MNPRRSAPKADALPGCATLRKMWRNYSISIFFIKHSFCSFCKHGVSFLRITTAAEVISHLAFPEVCFTCNEGFIRRAGGECAERLKTVFGTLAHTRGEVRRCLNRRWAMLQRQCRPSSKRLPPVPFVQTANRADRQRQFCVTLFT